MLITARRDSEETEKNEYKKKNEKEEEHESKTTRPSHCGGKTATEQTFNEPPRLKSGVLEFEETTTMKNPRVLDNGHPRRVHCRGFGRFANFLRLFLLLLLFFFSSFYFIFRKRKRESRNVTENSNAAFRFFFLVFRCFIFRLTIFLRVMFNMRVL